MVIGILIALQINTFNQERLDRKVEKEILKRILKDLQSDLTGINTFSESNEIRMLKIVWVLNEFGRENDFNHWPEYQLAHNNFPDINELLSGSIGETIMTIRWYNLFEESDITIQEIMSTGKLEIISNDQIKTEIQSFYTRVERAKQLQRLLTKNGDELVNNLLSQNISIANKLNKEELIQQLKSPDLLIALLENFMYATNATSQSIFINENSLKNRTHELIENILAYTEEPK